MAETTMNQRATAARLVMSRSDEDFVTELARGSQDALGPLYTRYAASIFRLAEQSLGRAAAEEVVQEVFLAVWRSAGSFDPAQGAFRPWLYQLAHWKILNELRRRRRRPAEQSATSEEDEEGIFARFADREPGPEEVAWMREHGRIVQSALDSLPDRQRQAVSLAFLGDMTHEQVAEALDVPLGTAKTRIRSGLQGLRVRLAPVAASLLAVGVAVVGVRLVQSDTAYQRDERALSLVTTSELVPLRLTPAPASAGLLPGDAHANYRGRDGNRLAVLTVEHLPAAGSGQTYQAWVRHGQTWTSLGTFTVQADGAARLIAEDAALAVLPDRVVVTVEPSGGSSAPGPNVLLTWPAA
jgi:RNA polymerase sigma-70 factor (ECF subfamily)